MHRAPAVNFSVKRSRWHAWLIVCVSLLACVVLGMFAWGQTLQDVRMLVLVIAILCTTGVAFAGWRKSAQGDLLWDGERWHWSGFAPNSVCRLSLLLDFQRVVLVSVMADARAPICLWLEAAPGDTNWTPLRRAMVSSRAMDAGGYKELEPVSEGGVA